MRTWRRTLLTESALSLISAGDVINYSHACLKTCVTALRSGDPALLATGYAAIGYNYGVSSLWWPSNIMLRRAQRFASQSGDRDTSPTIANVAGHAALSLYMQGRSDESIAQIGDAISSLKRFGDPSLLGVLQHHLRHAFMAIGDSQQELEVAREERELADKMSGWELKCWANYGLASALSRMGRITEALQHAEQSTESARGRKRFVTESIALHHYAFVALQASDYDLAAELSEQSVRIIRKQMLLFEFTVYAFPRLIEGLLGPNWTTSPDRDRSRKAAKCSKWSRLAGWRFPNVRPIAQRVEGRRHASRGQTERARKYFERAIETGNRYHCRYEAARAMIDLAAISPDRAESLRDDASKILRELKATIPAAEAWQLGEDPSPDLVAEANPN